MINLEVETVNNKVYKIESNYTLAEFLDHVAYDGSNSLIPVLEGEEYVAINKLVRVKVLK
jgi:hypothetical protein